MPDRICKGWGLTVTARMEFPLNVDPCSTVERQRRSQSHRARKAMDIGVENASQVSPTPSNPCINICVIAWDGLTLGAIESIMNDGVIYMGGAFALCISQQLEQPDRHVGLLIFFLPFRAAACVGVGHRVPHNFHLTFSFPTPEEVPDRPRDAEEQKRHHSDHESYEEG